MVPSTEVNVAEGQNEPSVKDAFANGNETVIYDQEVKDSIESEMLKCVRCLWASDELHWRWIHRTKDL